MLIECGREVAFSAASCTPDLARVECHVVEYVPTYICDRLLGREGGNVHEMTLARENLRRGEQVSRASATAAPETAGPRRDDG